MRFVKRGKCPAVLLDNNEIATAIRAYLVAHDVYAGEVNTVCWETLDNGITECAVLVNSSDRLIVNGNEFK